MRTTDEALAFLKSHQPLTLEDEADSGVLEQLDEARNYFRVHPSAEAIPLWLGVFGPGSGGGVYQLVEDLLGGFPRDLVATHLVEALASPHESVRYWCAQIAATLPSPSLVPPLRQALANGSRDTRDAIVTALESIGTEDAVASLKRWLRSEHDPEIRAAIAEVVGRTD